MRAWLVGGSVRPSVGWLAAGRSLFQWARHSEAARQACLLAARQGNAGWQAGRRAGRQAGRQGNASSKSAHEDSQLKALEVKSSSTAHTKERTMQLSRLELRGRRGGASSRGPRQSLRDSQPIGAARRPMSE